MQHQAPVAATSGTLHLLAHLCFPHWLRCAVLCSSVSPCANHPNLGLLQRIDAQRAHVSGKGRETKPQSQLAISRRMEMGG